MPKLSFLKIIERALIPTTLVVGTKLATVFIGSTLLQVNWDFTFTKSLEAFSFSFEKTRESLLLNSLSDLATILVCAVGFCWVLFRSGHFSQDIIHPSHAANLVRRRQSFLLTSLTETLQEGLVWLTLSWLAFLVSLVNFLFGYTGALVLGVALVVSLGLSWGLWLEYKKLAVYTSKT